MSEYLGLHNEWLLDALREHGIAAELHGDWVVPDADASASIPVQALAFRVDGPSVVVLFEARAVLPDGRMLMETIAGFGDDDQSALKQAQAKFLAGPFHALIEGLYGARTNQVEIEAWRVGEASYTAYVGSYLLFGVRFDVPPQLRERVQAWVAAQPGDRAEFHWCRVFWGGSVTEVLWDNETLAEAERELATLPWPDVDGYASVRLFLLLRGPSQTDRRVLECVDTAVRLFPQLEDDAYWEALERTMTAREAQLATNFMQIAFGRALIARLFPVGPESFVDEFTWSDRDEEVAREKLSTHPYFRAGVRAARLAEFATLKAIGTSSAEFNALNQALHAASERGVQPDDEWFAGIRFSSLAVPRPPSDA